jgi:hypothetical protein
MSFANDQPLPPATCCQFTYQEFGLAFTTMILRCQVEMANRRVDTYPKYQSANRPVMLIVTV